MKYSYTDTKTKGALILSLHEPGISKTYFSRTSGFDFYTIAWNTGADQQIQIDGMSYRFPGGSLLPLMMNQSYRFDHAEDIIAFQFNRAFYCVVDHDAEVSCVGFIFYGPVPVMFIRLDGMETENMHRLTDMFAEEFEGDEDIKSDMLRILLVRLIIKLTRLAKKQFFEDLPVDQSYHVMRQYSLLVERHFKKEKQVSFYAAQMHKSPKTLSNLFSRYNQKTPLQIIHQRILLETQRLLFYTDKSVKEIAYELGFEDAANFSKFIKGLTGKTPGELRKPSVNG
ncbi:MAG: helix-turn-helix domain-containing protein [Chitinophagaceae bacterium]|jgi:AraC-like DNA-binding protein|nr:helix-turn-helix domain-containing protein [Chitinophagaceae bacterium]